MTLSNLLGDLSLQSAEVARGNITLATPVNSTADIDVEGATTLTVHLLSNALPGGQIQVRGTMDETDPNGWDYITGMRGDFASTSQLANGVLTALGGSEHQKWIFPVQGLKQVRFTVSIALGGAMQFFRYALTRDIFNPFVYIRTAGANIGAAVSGSVSVNGSGASSIAKAEDAIHTTGDLGVPAWGVRVSSPPLAPTSAPGDYGYLLVDAEGKQILSGSGDPANSFQAVVDLTTTSDVALKASGGASMRNHITDIVLDNTGAAAARVTIKDGSTVVFRATVPAGSTFNHSFKTPIRGTAATAVNGALTAAGTVTVTLLGYIGW